LIGKIKRNEKGMLLVDGSTMRTSAFVLELCATVATPIRGAAVAKIFMEGKDVVGDEQGIADII
jgi:hypothetical protein